MFNLPIFLLIGYVDYTIITYRQNKNQHYGIGVSLLVDFATTVVFIIILETLVAGICFLLQLKEFFRALVGEYSIKLYGRFVY